MKISIITATYNSEATLERCLRSVAEQTAIDSIEHIIIDGKSNDKTIEIASQFPHIQKIISEKDFGIFDAFNKGLNISAGEIIYFIGSDDWLVDEDIIKKIINIFEEEKNLDYILGKVLMYDEYLKYSWIKESRTLKVNNDVIQHPSHQAFFIKKGIVDSYGGFPECFEIVADSYVMLKAIKEKNGLHVDVPVAYFSNSGISNNQENMQLISRELSSLYLLLDLDDEHKTYNYNINSEVNFLALKKLFANKNLLCKASDGLFIFGVRDISLIVYDLLSEKNKSLFCGFVTSNGGPDVQGEKVYSLKEIPEGKIVINCIEGEHHDSITEKILNKSRNSKVIDWKNIYKELF